MPRKSGKSIAKIKSLVAQIDKKTRGKDLSIKKACLDLGLNETQYYAMRNRLKRAGEDIPDLQHPERAELIRSRKKNAAKTPQKKRKYNRRTPGMINPIAANLANETEDDELESYDKPELIRTLRRERIETKQKMMRTASKMGSLLNMVGSSI